MSQKDSMFFATGRVAGENGVQHEKTRRLDKTEWPKSRESSATSQLETSIASPASGREKRTLPESTPPAGGMGGM